MKVAIMQPYLFPYIGYFQLIHSVDIFVTLDNVNFIKKGWINKNQILAHDHIQKIQLPVSKMSQNRWINQHEFHELDAALSKLTSQCEQTYSKQQGFQRLHQLLKQHELIKASNVADFLHQSIQMVSDELGLTTKFLKASDIEVAGNLTGQERILAICNRLKAAEYINLPGGRALYSEEKFRERKLKLSFLSPKLEAYQQQKVNSEFVSYLSILDILANCNSDVIAEQVTNYDLT